MKQNGATARVKYRAFDRKALYFKAKADRSHTAIRQNPNKQMRQVMHCTYGVRRGITAIIWKRPQIPKSAAS